MRLEEIIEKMSFHERKVMRELAQLGDGSTIEKMVQATGLDQATIMRAALTLSESGLVMIDGKKMSQVSLTPEGQEYARNGLPERRMLQTLSQSGQITVDEAASRAGLEGKLKKIAITWLKRRSWVSFIKKDEKTVLKITEIGEKALSQKSADEKLLESLASKEHHLEELSAEDREMLRLLRERKLVEIKEESRRELKLSDLGRRAVEMGIELIEEVSELTREMLLSGRWREVRLKKYDVVAPGVPIYPGKAHPLQQLIEEIREILLEMGFAEIKSRIVESEFWNFDALFQAQNHPAREIHDSFSLAKPRQASTLPSDLLSRVARAHERGVAGSTGWGYKFNPEVSRRLVLCSQTTAATVRYLSSHPDPPIKVFCIDRVYRHEKIDYKHLAEFYQAEGIVMDEGLTLRDMLGYLKQIMVKLGLPQIRFRPGYFPYTEPSVEADVYFPEKREWLEVLGAGMFRPELLRPLGIRYPVLAWGIGFSRLSMLRLGIDDIRDLYNNDISWLQTREMI
ncbi:MAG: phenylalanine--tRNA ligase subunit alpha [Candidatus Hadarchaeum sp.]|uniref:phenylalanine--tRNA ligase subunit alpha n=1 Tax=Candidatus Hadarchaeum sp. TaxID=2883567 RepID=UPI003D0CF9D2